MSLTLEILGQDSAVATLNKMADKLPNSIILHGPSGIGKKLTAIALYKTLECLELESSSENDSLFAAPTSVEQKSAEKKACLRCKSCLQIEHANHPDILMITPQGDVIPVESLRELKRSLHFPPMQGKKRFIIIDDAHKLSHSSANALLKILEEPPTHSHFFLIYPDLSLAPPTILSRCQRVSFQPLDDETLSAIIERNGLNISPKLLSTVLKILGGGASRLQQYAQEEMQIFIQTSLDLLRSNPKLEQLIQFTESLCNAGKEDELELFIDLILIRNHDLTLKHSKVFDSNHSKSEMFTANRFAAISLELARIRQQLEKHSNKKLSALALSGLLFDSNQTYHSISNQGGLLNA